MSTEVDRRVLLGSAANFRELGGLPVSGGTVRRGEVFRSATLSRLSDEDLPTFSGLGITLVFDLRTAIEAEASPSRVPGGISLVNLDVLADGTAGVAQAVAKMRTEPQFMNEMLAGNKVDDLLHQSYREFITLPSAHRAYRAFFEGLADEGREGAVLFHCTAGKDRTGWAAASLLMLLGADDTTVRADYLQTNTDYLPTLQPFIDRAAEHGVDPELLRLAFAVKDEYLDTALGELESRFGTIERYFAEGLGLASSTIDALRARLTQ